MFEGKGTYYFVDGDKYTGGWKANQKDGDGFYERSDKEVIAKKYSMGVEIK